MVKTRAPASKNSVKSEEKLRRLRVIRGRLNKYDQRFYPGTDETEHLLDQIRDWAKLSQLELSQGKLSELAGNSVFPLLMRFCKQELGGIVKLCENYRTAGNRTLPDFEIASIKKLSNAADLETVNKLYPSVERIYIVSALARAMQTIFRALTHPATLTDLSISELRGNIMEVVAHAHIEIFAVTRDLAEQGIKEGIDQAQATIKAVGSNRKITDLALEEMKVRASELIKQNNKLGSSELARRLLKEFPNKEKIKAREIELKATRGLSAPNISSIIKKEFPQISFNTLRKYPWLKELTEP